ncbi:SHOCT domain-containing protein [Subtercola frigoramans]|uniref:Membrane protein n=1 Tax=Subtercola frigoramans TaxID=120298 RepID=A0ABS2L104_9MICO|nr:SHOCT domain-containing protein [Subtercola frigoramans]MBM7470752.1 putative membrane protein [Subtercola frigoramans]
MSGNSWQFNWAWLFGALVVVGVVLLGVLAVRLLLSRRPSASTLQSAPAPAASAVKGEPTPRQILDARYARGELTTDEYRERVATLGGAS